VFRSFRSFSKWVLILLLIFSGVGCQPREAASTPTGKSTSIATTVSQRTYEVHEHLTLVNQGPAQPEKQNLWVALIRDFPPYQKVISMKVSPADYKTSTDEYGNQYAEFDFSDHPAGTTKTVDMTYQVVVNELTYDLSDCEGQLIDDFVQPELHIESANPQIIDLAKELARGKKTACQQVRAFYDYIGSNLVYTYNGKNWGAQAALGSMGADCTEYASLLVALSRSQHIPARYFEGLLFLNTETKAKAQLEHAWSDVYLPSVGWTALDPTLGRALGDRDTYFAHYTLDHIIVTMGANPSTLRGGSYWTHLYWPGNSTTISVQAGWNIKLME
jgi:transglutaminase-like putative cysteine protease